ncbi:MAG: MopE-related protein, partial [Myxococcota bacterium]
MVRRAGWFAVLAGCSTDVVLDQEKNVEPAAHIDAPASGTLFTTEDAVEFVGTVADGNGIDDLTNVVWTSSLDGVLSDPEASAPDPRGVTTASVALSEGIHAITLTVTDTAGLEAVDSITVTVEVPAEEPTAEITSPANLERFELGAVVSFVGGASDPNEAPSALVATWTAEAEDGQVLTLGTDAPSQTGVTSTSWTTEAPGSYVVALEVLDGDGNVARDEILIDVFDPDTEDHDGDGWSVAQGDCDDADVDIHPQQLEACNGLDDDCNGQIDDKDLDVDNHVDQDCDAYGGGLPIDDCDDQDATVYPEAAEQSDGLDNDCDGLVDDELSEFDNDGDCWCTAPACVGSVNPLCTTVAPGDCDDTNAALNQDDLDADGSSTCAGDCADTDPTRSALDGDGDGFSTCALDCDDTDPALRPDDRDLDGASTCAGDCDDLDASRNRDDDDGDGFDTCAGDCDDSEPLLNLFDFDADGFDTCEGDCNDFSATLTPADTDGDGFSTCAGDCNDGSSVLNPADTDGDGQSSCAGDCNDANSALDTLDHDGDGVSTCAADCDDGDAAVYPNAIDAPDTSFVDQNCDGIDGDKDLATFVAPGGANVGDCPFTAPCGSIQYALDRADVLGLPEVYLRAGTYTGALTVDFQTVDLYGGYDSAWDRDDHAVSGHLATIVGGNYAADTEYLVIRARTADLGVFDLVLQAPTAVGTESSKGRSSYGIHAVGSTVRVERSEVVQGNGAAGVRGVDGISASTTAAAGGAGGQSGESFNDTCDTGRKAGGAGGVGACTGTNGGAGGAGGQMDGGCDSVLGVEFCDPCDATAGLGGGNASVWLGGSYGAGGG